jgi:hypothetical protein
VRVRQQDGTVVDLPARTVVVCAGAIGSPVLLRRSGLLRGPVRLGMHPMAKVVARFDEDVNTVPEVAAVQVREFAPRMTFGSSASSPGMLAVGMLRTPRGDRREQALGSPARRPEPLSRAVSCARPCGDRCGPAPGRGPGGPAAGPVQAHPLLLGAGATWVVPAATGRPCAGPSASTTWCRGPRPHERAPWRACPAARSTGALRGTRVADALVLPPDG